MYKHKLKSNSKVIDISTQCIAGILDLKENTRLEILDCSNNLITTITNIPLTLEELNCSRNLLINLDGLPNNLIKLDCSFNQITQLDNLPYGLVELICKKNEFKYLEMIPEGLEILDCANNQLEKLEDLPNSLKKLNCSSNQITWINFLPEGLIELNCSLNFIWKISKLPSSLKELDCSCNKIEGEFVFVPNLTNAYIQNNLIESLNNLESCSKLKILNCENNKITKIDGIPNRLEEFIANKNNFDWIWTVPRSLEVIGIEKHKINPNTNHYKTLILLDNL